MSTSRMYVEFVLTHVDEFIDELLHSDRACDVILPRIQVTLSCSALYIRTSQVSGMVHVCTSA